MNSEFLTAQYWTKKRIFIIVFSFTFAIAGLYFGNEFSKDYKLGINPYYNTSTSCMDERFYILKKFKTDEERLAGIQKGNILAFNSSEVPTSIYKKQVEFAKYVEAVEGDHIQIKDHKLYINGEYVSERSFFMINKLRKNGYDALTNDVEFTVGKGEFLPLGTNTDHSFDGRFWGTANYKDVTGVVVWKGVTWL